MTAKGARADDGFILVVVLVLLMALATLASIYSVYAGNSAAESRTPEDRLRGEAAARSGLELAALQLLARSEGQRPSHGDFVARVGAVDIEVAYRTEAARVDLNAAPKELISGLFQSLGASESAADAYAQSLVARRTPTGSAPRATPLQSVFELYVTPGLPREVVAGVLPYVTVYSGRAQVDVAEADARVLAAIPGLAPDALAAVIAAREKGVTADALIRLLGAAAKQATAEPGRAYRVDVVVGLRNRRMRAQIVLSLNDDAANPYEILYWRDDFDGPPSNV